MREQHGLSRFTRVAVATGLGLGLVFASVSVSADHYRGAGQSYPNYGAIIGGAVASIFLYDQHRHHGHRHYRAPQRRHYHGSHHGHFKRHHAPPRYGHHKGHGRGHFKNRKHRRGNHNERFAFRYGDGRQGGGNHQRQRSGQRGMRR